MLFNRQLAGLTFAVIRLALVFRRLLQILDRKAELLALIDV